MINKDILYDPSHRSDVIRIYKGISPTIAARAGTGGGNLPLTLEEISCKNCTQSSVKMVRRLTPVECERLQGLPDNYTLTDNCSDSKRYKAIGNGMAQPCADFILRGISKAFL